MRTTWTAVLACALIVTPSAPAGDKTAPEDKRTTAQLLDAMKGDVPFERLAAAKALAARGPAELPVLLKALGDENADLRRSATDALAAMGADANSAGAALAKALKDGDAWVRAGAAGALGGMGELPAAQAKALAAACADSDPWVREVAMSVLPKATKDKALLVAAACEAIGIPHTSWGICRHAMGILKQHGASDRERVAAALLKMLADPPQGMWDAGPAAVELLVQMGHTKPTVAALIKLLDHRGIQTVGRAADRLAQIGPDAKDALPALRRIQAAGISYERASAAVAKAIAVIEGKEDPSAKKPRK